MQFNYYFLKVLSKELEGRLVGLHSSTIFSQNKDELILCFANESSEFIIKANLDSQTSLLSFPSNFARARKNSVNLFSDIIGMKVTGVRQFLNERSLSIQFTDDFELLFRLHGRHSNVVLFQNGSVCELFKKSIVKDNELKLESLDRKIDQNDDNIIRTQFNLAETFPTFDKNIKQYLKSQGFHDAENYSKLNILRATLNELEESSFYVLKSSPSLRLLKPEEEFDLFNTAIEASNHLARVHFHDHGFSQLKNSLLSQVNKQIKKSESYIQQNLAKLNEIENRRGYDELANILMANLHVQKEASATAIELFDFYNNQQIKIKLKPNQSLQINAENLYRKAKNQVKEIAVLKSNISNKQSHLIELKNNIEEINQINDIKQLKALVKLVSTNKKKEPTPFIELEIEGFQVFIGKNAKNNDLLTQKFARKDDLWLHAKDVSGSHTIIRNPNGINIPMYVIEQVAQLAAWYSKRKSDTLCPVIYTPKKYVRKPKGSLPGQVVVSKEQVVLVEPKRSYQ